MSASTGAEPFWSEHRLDELYVGWISGASYDELVHRLGVSLRTVQRMVARTGLVKIKGPPPPPKGGLFGFTPEQVQNLRECWANCGMTTSAIASHFGIFEDLLRRKATALGLGKRTTQGGKPRVWSDEELSLLRNRQRDGQTLIGISRVTGISRATLRAKARELGLPTTGALE